jgi:hypothetical protein
MLLLIDLYKSMGCKNIPKEMPPIEEIVIGKISQCNIPKPKRINAKDDVIIKKTNAPIAAFSISSVILYLYEEIPKLDT